MTNTELSLDDLLDTATPQYQDISICIDGALAAKREDLRLAAKAALAATEQGTNDDREGSKPLAVKLTEELRALDDEMRGRLLTIRITQMGGAQWSALKAKHPISEKNKGPYDEAQHCNVEAVARVALVTHGSRVLADGSTEPISAAQWTKLLDTISGGDMQNLLMTTFTVNQLNATLAVSTLAKG